VCSIICHHPSTHIHDTNIVAASFQHLSSKRHHHTNTMPACVPASFLHARASYQHRSSIVLQPPSNIVPASLQHAPASYQHRSSIRTHAQGHAVVIVESVAIAIAGVLLLLLLLLLMLQSSSAQCTVHSKDTQIPTSTTTWRAAAVATLFRHIPLPALLRS